jgi:tRNA 2-thiouridine synthesizing protein E
MAQKEFAGKAIEVNEEGYMIKSEEWTKEIAVAIATEEGLELTEKHFAVLEFIRNRVNSGEALTIRSISKSGVVDTKDFYQLFPGAPLKKATKIAGVPKPTSCI